MYTTMVSGNVVMVDDRFLAFLIREAESVRHRGDTHHMHIRGGKSDIFGLEYCQK